MSDHSVKVTLLIATKQTIGTLDDRVIRLNPMRDPPFEDDEILRARRKFGPAVVGGVGVRKLARNTPRICASAMSGRFLRRHQPPWEEQRYTLRMSPFPPRPEFRP
jgi:hypothetical protein